jgi:hypothetical protein
MSTAAKNSAVLLTENGVNLNCCLHIPDGAFVS